MRRDLLTADKVAARIILILFLLADQILLLGQAVQCIIFKPVRFFFFIDQRFQPPEAVVTKAGAVRSVICPKILRAKVIFLSPLSVNPVTRPASS